MRSNEFGGVNRRQFLKASALAAGASVLAACAPAGSGAGAEQEAAAEETQRGNLIGLYGGPINSFNPLTAVQGFQAHFFQCVLPPLIQENVPKTGFVPIMAESWEASEDATQYTFHIHPDAKWHDGTDFTSEDVLFTYELYLNPATKSRQVSNLAMIEGAEAYSNEEADSVAGITVVNDKTIRFTTAYPTGLFLFQAAHPILPKHILGDTDHSSAGPDLRRPCADRKGEGVDVAAAQVTGCGGSIQLGEAARYGGIGTR